MNTDPNPFRSPARAEESDPLLISSTLRVWMRAASASRTSIFIAVLLIAWDGILWGTYMASILICPMWFLISVGRNLKARSRIFALFRIAIPILTLVMVLGNGIGQWQIAETRAEQIIKACDQYRAVKGMYPSKLDDLVPEFLGSVPRAKYCVVSGEFYYSNDGSAPRLWWYKITPFGKEVYGFDKRGWRHGD
jgi:hypothetical protein